MWEQNFPFQYQSTQLPNFHSGKEIMILPSIIHLSFIWKTCYTHYPPHCNLFYSRYSNYSNIIICTVNVLCQTFFEYLEEVWILDLQPQSQSKERNRLLQDLKCFKPSVHYGQCAVIISRVNFKVVQFSKFYNSMFLCSTRDSVKPTERDCF